MSDSEGVAEAFGKAKEDPEGWGWGASCVTSTETRCSPPPQLCCFLYCLAPDPLRMLPNHLPVPWLLICPILKETLSWCQSRLWLLVMAWRQLLELTASISPCFLLTPLLGDSLLGTQETPYHTPASQPAFSLQVLLFPLSILSHPRAQGSSLGLFVYTNHVKLEAGGPHASFRQAAHLTCLVYTHAFPATQFCPAQDQFPTSPFHGSLHTFIVPPASSTATHPHASCLAFLLLPATSRVYFQHGSLSNPFQEKPEPAIPVTDPSPSVAVPPAKENGSPGRACLSPSPPLPPLLSPA